MTETSAVRVLVTDACRGAAVATIRALARGGYRVYAADASPHAPGMASRYVSERVVYACPMEDPDRFVRDVLDAVDRHRIDIIIPVTERALLPLESARDQFEDRCCVPWAPREAMATVRNKAETFRLAEALDVPVPRTRRVSCAEEAVQCADGLGWPVVLKPVSSHTLAEDHAVEFWSVSYARDPRQLREQMRQYAGRCDVLLQEYFQGDGVGVEVLAHEGRVLCAFQHRRLREVPLSGGASSLRRSEDVHPDLYEQTQRLIARLKWTGLAMVEFKLNSAQQSRLMEINGRIWGSLPVAIAAGMDFPTRLCRLLLEGPPDEAAAPDTEYRRGLHVQSLQKELSWMIRVLRRSDVHPLAQLPPRWAVLSVMADLFKPHYRFDILSLRDPLPGVRLLTNMLPRAGKKTSSHDDAAAKLSPPTPVTSAANSPVHKA
ncbi:carboxylate--amine ligase [Roseimaritima sediminicola]|uniref:carboxylate--amine ligase n=1 Tax=Roseimaritima sediminicola TaxID=2662066 RepID=UPI00129825DB|nr:ATP-grasp domain-containing protein [Roseimaritima sediminicola]